MEAAMDMKASEVGHWLRQMAGKRDHHEVLSDDYIVLRPSPNFNWMMGTGADQPTLAAPEPEPDLARDDRREDDSRPQ
jgi:hypothetical protein